MTPLRTTLVVLALPLVAASLVGCGSSRRSDTAGSAGGGTTVPGSAPATGVSVPTTSAPSGSSTIAPALSAPGQVAIADYDFTPNTVTVAVGETVTWTDEDTSDHWVVSAPTSPASFDLGRQRTSSQASHTFTAPGTYPYFCNLHNYMKGTVVVR